MIHNINIDGKEREEMYKRRKGEGRIQQHENITE